jgi:DNA-binding beta-propeller fold protein YncE/mono/diheme cytochrome c family protein
MKSHTTVAVASLVSATLLIASAAQADLRDEAVARHPVGVVVDQDGNRALVANKLTGSISIVDLEKREVVSDLKIASRLTAIETGVRPGTYLVTDFEQHQLICFRIENDQPVVDWRLNVAKYPVSICIDKNNKRCSVASLWSRRITLVELDQQPRVVATIDLEFSPKAQCVVGERLLVSDAFADSLSCVNLSDYAVEFTRKLPGHAPTTLTVSDDGKYLVTAQSMLNELAHSVRNDVHWGLVISNDARWIELQNVLDPTADIYRGAQTRQLGGAGDAKGDPGALVLAPDSTALITLGGVDQIAMGKKSDPGFSFVDVGRRPIALALFDNNRKIIVANQLDDSLSIVDLETEEPIGTIALGPVRERTQVEHGESLFFDARLSHDRWMSCHSCHTDGHANGMLNDNFSDQSFGAPKRVLSLLGGHATGPFAWNGSAETLEIQVRNSIEQTMQKDEKVEASEVQSIVAYLQTLAPPPSLDQSRGISDTNAIARGRDIFTAQKCSSCHTAPSFTSPQIYDVGLKDRLDNKEFNPPSLIGVSQRYMLLHDNRAESLEHLFTEYKHQLNGEMSAEQLSDLIAYLRSL